MTTRRMGTREIVLDLARSDIRVRLLHRVGRRGLASAVVEGIQSTTAPYVAVIDGDLQHDERLLPAMLARLNNGWDRPSLAFSASLQFAALEWYRTSGSPLSCLAATTRGGWQALPAFSWERCGITQRVRSSHGGNEPRDLGTRPLTIPSQ
jgi:glycosyltransferase involved in cell wall biosynthesis